jgi:hypothetical protein
MARTDLTRSRVLLSLVLILVFVRGPVARGAPTEQAPAISFIESAIQFASALTSVGIKACWGAYVVYDDVGPIDQLLVYHNYTVFDRAYPVPGFFGLAAAATDKGVVFVGQDASSGKIRIALLELGGATEKLPVFFDLDVSNITSGIFIKGNSLGDYAGGTVADGRLFVHWHSMPDGQHNYYTQPSNSRPGDVAYGWNSFYFTNSGSNSLFRIPYEGAPTTVALTYTPASITYGSFGVFYVSDKVQPLIWEYRPLTGTGTKWPVRAVTFGLAFTPDGLLLGVQLPRTITLFDLVAAFETSYTLLGVASLLDYVIVPGRYPYSLLIDEFVNSRGFVVNLQINGLLTNREAVSARRDGGFIEPVVFRGLF